jgi:hypothetical protein
VPPIALAFVNRGRWLAVCPFQCGGADVADSDRFLCRECLNRPVDHHPIPLVWPAPADVAAIEAALIPRPVVAQNWNLNETIGCLLAENVEHGLYDPTTGLVAGDIGADQMRAPAVLALAAARLELGA